MQFMRLAEPFADPWPNAAASVAQDGDVALVPPGVLLEWHRGQWIPLRDRVARGMTETEQDRQLRAEFCGGGR